MENKLDYCFMFPLNLRKEYRLTFKSRLSGLRRRKMLRYDTNVSKDLTGSIFRSCEMLVSHLNITQRRNPENLDLNLHQVKLSLCLTEHTMKAYWGSGGIYPHIL